MELLQSCTKQWIGGGQNSSDEYQLTLTRINLMLAETKSYLDWSKLSVFSSQLIILMISEYFVMMCWMEFQLAIFIMINDLKWHKIIILNVFINYFEFQTLMACL